MKQERQPLITIKRAAWKELTAQAAGNEREGGGLLVGRTTRYGNFQVKHVIGLTHVSASKGRILYDDEEVARARVAAHSVYAPLEPIGGWHSHPWPACNCEAMDNQISDDWNSPNSDVDAMLDGEIELIASTYPDPGYWINDSEYRIGVKIAGRIVRVEAWMRVKHGQIVPCTLKVR